ncbi:MAG: hypothetical protein ACOYBQ_10340 [Fluviibacter sp.]
MSPYQSFEAYWADHQSNTHSCSNSTDARDVARRAWNAAYTNSLAQHGAKVVHSVAWVEDQPRGSVTYRALFVSRDAAKRFASHRCPTTHIIEPETVREF